MVRIIKNVILLGLALILIVGGIIVVWKLDLFANDTQSDMAKQVEGDGIDIIVYGDLKSVDNVSFRTVTSLNKESLRSENQNQHHFLVIYDPKGNLELNQKELVELKDLCINEYLDLIYFGESFSQFQDAEFFTSCEDDDPMGFFYCGYQFHISGNPYTFNGEAWVNPDEPDTFYNNPFLSWFYSDNTKEDRKNAKNVWAMIYNFCLKNQENN